jgi:hypothetical protein
MNRIYTKGRNLDGSCPFHCPLTLDGGAVQRNGGMGRGAPRSVSIEAGRPASKFVLVVALPLQNFSPSRCERQDLKDCECKRVGVPLLGLNQLLEFGISAMAVFRVGGQRPQIPSVPVADPMYW